MGYDPELDISPELDPDAMSSYLTVISLLECVIELGRINTMTEVSLLSSHVDLDAAVHVMAHVGQRYNARVVHDPYYPEIYHIVIKNMIGQFYKDAKEATPKNVPEP